MNPREDLYFPLCAPYVLSALEGEELSQFEAHVKDGCIPCSDEIIDLAKVAALLAAAVPQVAPSSDLKERILFAARLATFARGHLEAAAATNTAEPVEETPAERPARPARRWLPIGAVIAGLGLLVVTGLYVRSLLSSIDNHELYIKTLQRHIAQLKNDDDSKEAILKTIEARRVDFVMLSGSAVSPFGYGKLIWDAETKGAIVQASNLPPPPDGSEYQLWAIRQEKPASIGVLELLSRREQESYFRIPLIQIDDLREIDGFTLTLEPKGGSGQPTGELYLLGKPSPKESLPVPRGNAGAP